MSYVIVGCLCAFFGFLIASLFNAQSYDHGFDDGWHDRDLHEKYDEEEENGNC